MALFKPLKGTRASLDTQPLHEGYAYFCVDDGSLHLDYTDSDGNLQRKQINAKDAETLMGKSLVELQSDWSVNDETDPAYVKNRPFYFAENVTIYDASITTSDIGGAYGYIDQSENAINIGSLVEGATYTVSFDDNTYTCVCSDGMNIGNLSLLSAGDATGEPFAFAVYSGQFIGIATTDTASATHTITVQGASLKTIDEQYLPELPYVTLQDGNKHWVTIDDFAPTNSSLTYRGQTYTSPYRYFMWFLTADGVWGIHLVVYNSDQVPNGNDFRMNYSSSDGTLSMYWTDESNTAEITTIIYAYLYDANTGNTLHSETDVQSVTIGAYTKRSHNIPFYIDKTTPQWEEIVRSFDDYIDVETALATKAEAEHTHEIADVTNLQTTLDGKANSEHAHEIADVNGLQTTLDGKASTAVATTSANGLMSSTDKAKVDTLPSTLADTTYTTARYRASSLHSTETTPTTNGVIAWMYE